MRRTSSAQDVLACSRPVFLDLTGRRQRRLAVIGVLAASLPVLFLLAVVAALIGPAGIRPLPAPAVAAAPAAAQTVSSQVPDRMSAEPIVLGPAPDSSATRLGGSGAVLVAASSSAGVVSSSPAVLAAPGADDLIGLRHVAAVLPGARANRLVQTQLTSIPS